MVSSPRSNVGNEIIGPWQAGRGGAACVSFARRASPPRPDRRSSAEWAVTCGDGVIPTLVPARAAGTGGRRPAGYLDEHDPRSLEPSACLLRIRVAGRFVHADVPVIICIRFRTGTSWRTMDREASTKGTAVPGSAGAGTCGGVMVRGPKSGNGTRSPVYYLDSAGLVPPRSPARALRRETERHGEMDPLAVGLAGGGWVPA